MSGDVYLVSIDRENAKHARSCISFNNTSVLDAKMLHLQRHFLLSSTRRALFASSSIEILASWRWSTEPVGESSLGLFFADASVIADCPGGSYKRITRQRFIVHRHAVQVSMESDTNCTFDIEHVSLFGFGDVIEQRRSREIRWEVHKLLLRRNHSQSPPFNFGCFAFPRILDVHVASHQREL
jgi:hypothetical protein